MLGWTYVMLIITVSSVSNARLEVENAQHASTNYYTSIACIVAYTYLLNPVSNIGRNQLDINKANNIVALLKTNQEEKSEVRIL